LILALAGGGLVWFDYLNIIDAKGIMAPVLSRLPFFKGEVRTQDKLGDDEFLNLDAERLAVRLEAEALRELELDKQEAEMASKQAEIEQMAQELEQRQVALDERENSLNAGLSDAEIISRNVESIAQQLNGMQPERAVAIIAEMNDQQAIDVLRKTDEIAQRDGTSSIVPYWMSLLPAARAAELQRKMASRPQ
jgi:flagellar protein FlbB